MPARDAGGRLTAVERSCCGVVLVLESSLLSVSIFLSLLLCLHRLRFEPLPLDGRVRFFRLARNPVVGDGRWFLPLLILILRHPSQHDVSEGERSRIPPSSL